MRLLLGLGWMALTAPAMASSCYGMVAQGRLEQGVKLPASGANFAAYSTLGVATGRTYVHSDVRDVVLDAYSALAQSKPSTHYVYGETGLANGGPMPPHKTHQAGISVDFMVPVLNAQGISVPLPSSPLNKFGYGLEFDTKGRYQNLRVDYEAMAEHLYQLSLAAQRHHLGITRVIFDPQLIT